MNSMTDQIKLVQNYQLNGQRLVFYLEDKLYRNHNCHWKEIDGFVCFWNSVEAYRDGLPYRQATMYKWKVINRNVVAWNLPAMRITPELAMIFVEVINGVNRKH